MRILELHDLREFMSSPKKVVITNHINPDGDAMGSALGLKHYLEKSNHEVNVVIPNEPADFLKWLPGADTAVVAEYHTAQSERLFAEADVVFCLDYNAISRAGEILAPMIEASPARKVLIDHHREPESWPNDMYSDIAKGSTCEMIYDLIEMWDGLSQVDEAIATCLYVGIVTDSGSFRFPSTKPSTHRAAAFLLECGARPEVIHERVYDVNTKSRMKLLGHLLDTMQFIKDRDIAILHLTKDVMSKVGYTKGDSEGFVNYGLSMKGMRMSVFFREDGDVCKCSFRSKGDLDVNTFARKYFNGGGHLNAAGGLFHGNAEEAIIAVREAIEKENL